MQQAALLVVAEEQEVRAAMVVAAATEQMGELAEAAWVTESGLLLWGVVLMVGNLREEVKQRQSSKYPHFKGRMEILNGDLWISSS